MKKKIILLIMLALLLSPAALFAKPTEEEAVQAFGVSFQAYFVSSLTAAFGQAPPGVTMTEELTTFDNIDLEGLQVDNEMYKTMSGKIFIKNGNNIKAVLKLTGGPVKNLEWKIDTFDAQKANEVQINADGRILTYNTSNIQP